VSERPPQVPSTWVSEPCVTCRRETWFDPDVRTATETQGVAFAVVCSASCAKRLVDTVGKAIEETTKPGACMWCDADPGACDCADRLACSKAGQVGHWFCGECPRCKIPRHRCGHSSAGSA